MGKDGSVTPKGTLTLKNVGPGFGKDSVAVAGLTTLKYKRDKISGSLALTDGTLKDPKSLRDLIATADYVAPRSVTLNGKYELGIKKYTAGATWNGNVANKATTLKMWYTNKDNLVGGEATINVAPNQKAYTLFNQKQLLSAKYTYIKGDYTVEPSYTFTKSAPALAVTRKMSSKDTLKATYDWQAEGATLQWARKPFTITMASSVSHKLKVGKPTLSAIFENVYEF